MDYISELIMEVSKGNPGALTVIKRLEWYSKWFELIKFMKKIDLVGGEIWAKYKDEFHQDIDKFERWLEEEMYKDREFEHLKPSNKIPKKYITKF